MHKPLLIDKLKFDLRIYVLITGVAPLRCFIYKEGLARFATEAYKSPAGSNLNNLYMHLTNYAINKESDKYVRNRHAEKDNVGHKRSLSSILTYIDEMRQFRAGWPTGEKVWDGIKALCLKTIISGIHHIDHVLKGAKPGELENSMCFQILGIDVMLDENCKPWLLEVNHSPSFGTDAPLDLKLKKGLLVDTIHILNLTQ